MNLTQAEMARACEVAALEVERRMDRFKPNKPAIRNERGWICEQVYKGSVDTDLMCSILLQWNYTAAGAIGRITQGVHVRLRCFVKPEGGRVLRLVSFHRPEFEKSPNGTYGSRCRHCGDGFHEHHVIKADTSLQEY